MLVVSSRRRVRHRHRHLPCFRSTPEFLKKVGRGCPKARPRFSRLKRANVSSLASRREGCGGERRGALTIFVVVDQFVEALFDELIERDRGRDKVCAVNDSV